MPTILTPYRTGAPAALDWDGTARDFKRDAAGRMKSRHPVDAKVDFLLRVRKGSVKSAPDSGHTLSEIQYFNPRTVQSDVETRVALALAEPVAAKEIEILGVEVDTSVKYRLLVGVTYRNLITGKLNATEKRAYTLGA